VTDPTGITVDVREFAHTSAIDTCSIWNLFSSPRLLGAALRMGRWFLVAGYVRYEALEKPRTRPSSAELVMQDHFRQCLAGRQGFDEQRITLDDLQAVAAVRETHRLGRGEVAALALARKFRSAVLTEDQRARAAAPKVGVGPAQTTPQLLGWLIYRGELTDGDVSVVISEHEARIGENRGRLTVHLRRIHAEAYRCRLLRDGPSDGRAEAG
jgi:hypothetical protein